MDEIRTSIIKTVKRFRRRMQTCICTGINTKHRERPFMCLCVEKGAICFNFFGFCVLSNVLTCRKAKT